MARTRTQIGEALDELNARLEHTRRRVPFYGADRRQLLLVGGVIGATTLMAFVALQARNHDSWGPFEGLHRRLSRRRPDLAHRLQKLVDRLSGT